MVVSGRILRRAANRFGEAFEAIVPTRLRKLLNTPPLLVTIAACQGGFSVNETVNGPFGLRDRGTTGRFEALPQVAEYLRRRKRYWGPFINAELVIPEDRCFVIEREIPARAGSMASGIAELELERVAPFSLEQVLLGHYRRIADSDRKDTSFLKLFAAKKTFVMPFIEAIADAGIGLRAIGVVDAEGARYPVDLRGQEVRKLSARPFGAILNRVLVACSVLFVFSALAFVCVDGWKRMDALARLNEELDTVRQAAMVEANSTEIIRTQLEQIDAVRTAKMSRPSLIEIWDEASRVMPVVSWVEQLRVKGDAVVLSGYSSAASSLIRALTASPLFADVEFSAPVSRDPVSGIDRFEISLRIVNRPRQQAAAIMGGDDRAG